MTARNDVPPGATVVGRPAREIGARSERRRLRRVPEGRPRPRRPDARQSRPVEAVRGPGPEAGRARGPSLAGRAREVEVEVEVLRAEGVTKP